VTFFYVSAINFLMFQEVIFVVHGQMEAVRNMAPLGHSFVILVIE